MTGKDGLDEYLRQYHCGEENAVSSRELERVFRLDGAELRRTINALREKGVPICSFDGGYYYAATDEELRRTIWQFRSRIRRMAIAERGLSHALAGYANTGKFSRLLDGGDVP